MPRSTVKATRAKIAAALNAADAARRILGEPHAAVPSRRFAVGDRVLVNTHSNLGIVPATVRSTFLQTTLMRPTPTPAVTLNELSWAYESDVTPLDGGARFEAAHNVGIDY